jgi:hypothetical protein
LILLRVLDASIYDQQCAGKILCINGRKENNFMNAFTKSLQTLAMVIGGGLYIIVMFILSVAMWLLPIIIGLWVLSKIF